MALIELFSVSKSKVVTGFMYSVVVKGDSFTKTKECINDTILKM